MKKENVDNVIELPIQHKLDEQDVVSLFLGLCKMVKRLAREDACRENAKKIALIESNYKKRIENLELLNSGLKKEIDKLQKANLDKLSNV